MIRIAITAEACEELPPPSRSAASATKRSAADGQIFIWLERLVLRR
jgi:hypothetical protein